MSKSKVSVDALVIGGGPAGLAAAEVLSAGGLGVLVADAKPSLGRKFLMAGKSGLNLTMNAPNADLIPAYAEAADWLAPMLTAFDAQRVTDWAEDLGQPVFAGSTGRVFPRAMKASPLLRAWLARLAAAGVDPRTRWRWTGWDGQAAIFDTPDGKKQVVARATVLALGGGSWARLGSDGSWAGILARDGAQIAPFAPANAAVAVNWTDHMTRVFGQPLKNVGWRAGTYRSRGEAVITPRGLEGGGIYAVSRGVREGAALTLDLVPDLDVQTVESRLARPRGKASLSSHLRKTLRLGPAQQAILNAFERPLPGDPAGLAARVKSVGVQHAGLRPLDEAISTAGGLRRVALTDDLMLRTRPGVFCAGEMLDWEAPTGGYLLTACFATGRWAGAAALRYAAGSPATRAR